MKYVILSILLLALVSCTSSDKQRLTLEMLGKLEPLNAQAQADAIKQCESNDGWTGKPVTFNEICVQIRCIPIEPAEKD